MPPAPTPTSPAAEHGALPSVDGLRGFLTYLALGIFFGFVITKTEVVSWFRIQEMFRFGSFHMYGVLASAVAVATVSLAVVRRSGIRAANGEPILVPPKALGTGTRYWAGGILFGFGWAFTGACPGPLFALVGSGISVIVVPLVSALAGMWVYAHLRPRLPH